MNIEYPQLSSSLYALNFLCFSFLKLFAIPLKSSYLINYNEGEKMKASHNRKERCLARSIRTSNEETIRLLKGQIRSKSTQPTLVARLTKVNLGKPKVGRTFKKLDRDGSRLNLFNNEALLSNQTSGPIQFGLQSFSLAVGLSQTQHTPFLSFFSLQLLTRPINSIQMTRNQRISVKPKRVQIINGSYMGWMRVRLPNTLNPSVKWALLTVYDTIHLND